MAEEQIYIYQGYAYGTFENAQHKQVPFYNLYVTSQIPPYEMDNYHAEGFKAEKFKVANLDALRIGELVQGDYITLFP